LAGEALDIDDFAAIDAHPIAVAHVCPGQSVLNDGEAKVVRYTCDIGAFSGLHFHPWDTGPRRDLIGLAVYQRAGGQRVTMPLVNAVIAELKAHSPECP